MIRSVCAAMIRLRRGFLISVSMATSTADARGLRAILGALLDGGDVDFLHRHHRLEGTLSLIATSCERIGSHARRRSPGEAPVVLAPTALTFLAAVADDGVPVAVRLSVCLPRSKGKGLAVLELRAAVETETGNAQNGELHR